MSVPERDEFRRPTLEALADGSAVDAERVRARVQEILGLSDEDRNELRRTAQRRSSPTSSRGLSSISRNEG
jgi:restriction endonuclease Mrr